jgi:hypothetical protein
MKLEFFFTPDCPLGLEVQKLLLGQVEGLSVAEIRRTLRRQGQVIEEHNLRELLAHPEVFVNLSGDKFNLLGQTRQASHEKKQKKLPTTALLRPDPFPVNLSQAIL